MIPLQAALASSHVVLLPPPGAVWRKGTVSFVLHTTHIVTVHSQWDPSENWARI